MSRDVTCTGNTAVGLRSNTWGTVSVGMWDTPFNTMTYALSNANVSCSDATCQIDAESNVDIDCTRGAPVVLRPGAISREQIEAVTRQALPAVEVLRAGTLAAPRASGTLEAHYAPRAKLRLMDARSLQAALDLLGSDLDASSTVIATYSRVVLRSRSNKVLRRRMPDDAAATAQQLFAVLRDFDAQGAQLIWVETPPDTPEWEGVRDRLQRAAAA